MKLAGIALIAAGWLLTLPAPRWRRYCAALGSLAITAGMITVVQGR
jgi:hypothetical protein